ncbi:MAG TPA: hypothetical protein VGH20_20150 [Myxococcales bacterium]|jgi:hypothetical protein
MLEQVIERARERAVARVAALGAAHPGDDEVALGRRLVTSAARRAGWTGAATGALSLLTLPVGLPAGVAASLLHEAELIFALCELHGVETAGEAGKAKLLALWAGAGFADAAKSVGLRAGARAIGSVLRGSLPGRVIRRLNPKLVKAILARLGMGWVPRAMKLWPLLGAPIAYAIDRGALQALGDATLATLHDAARKQRRAAPPASARQPRQASRRKRTRKGPVAKSSARAVQDGSGA